MDEFLRDSQEIQQDLEILRSRAALEKSLTASSGKDDTPSQEPAGAPQRMPKGTRTIPATTYISLSSGPEEDYGPNPSDKIRKLRLPSEGSSKRGESSGLRHASHSDRGGVRLDQSQPGDRRISWQAEGERN